MVIIIAMSIINMKVNMTMNMKNNMTINMNMDTDTDMNMHPPSCVATLRRTFQILAYYTKWNAI